MPRKYSAELGVRYEANASEAAAAAMLAASVHYPIRGAVTFKGAVGVNVASDALANLSSSGVTGGALVIIGEDYGEGSSIMQERSHAFAMKSQMWLLDPRPNLPSIVQSVHQGFELSEATNTPVMLMVRIRSCHVTGSFRPRTTNARRSPSRMRSPIRAAITPASFCRRCPTCRSMTRSTTVGRRHRPISSSTVSTRCSARGGSGRHRSAGRHVQWCDPRAAAPRPRRHPR
jgi:TPP-dependent indolepyruvate ferredoxin oxidoreductase alpha subunit